MAITRDERVVGEGRNEKEHTKIMAAILNLLLPLNYSTTRNDDTIPNQGRKMAFSDDVMKNKFLFSYCGLWIFNLLKEI